VCIALTICGIQLNFKLEPRRWRGDSKADYPGSSSEHSDEELSASNDGRGRVTGVSKTVGRTKRLTAPGRGKDRAPAPGTTERSRTERITLPNQAHRRRSGCAACLHVRPCTSRSDRPTNAMCHRFGHAAIGLGHTGRPACHHACPTSRAAHSTALRVRPGPAPERTAGGGGRTHKQMCVISDAVRCGAVQCAQAKAERPQHCTDATGACAAAPSRQTGVAAQTGAAAAAAAAGCAALSS
jgi:hypothetical protein